MSSAPSSRQPSLRNPRLGSDKVSRELPRLAALALVIPVLAGCSASIPASDADSTQPAPGAAVATGETSVPGTATDDGAADPGETPAEAGMPPACDLLTTDQVEAAVGGRVEEHESGDANCSWSPLTDEEGMYVSVSLVPLAQQDCLDIHETLGTTETFEYEVAGEAGVPGFWRYSQTLAGTYIGTYELCTPQANVGVRVESAEGSPADEPGQRAIATQLVPLVLEQLGAALRP